LPKRDYAADAEKEMMMLMRLMRHDELAPSYLRG